MQLPLHRQPLYQEVAWAKKVEDTAVCELPLQGRRLQGLCLRERVVECFSEQDL